MQEPRQVHQGGEWRKEQGQVWWEAAMQKVGHQRTKQKIDELQACGLWVESGDGLQVAVRTDGGPDRDLARVAGWDDDWGVASLVGAVAAMGVRLDEVLSPTDEVEFVSVSISVFSEVARAAVCMGVFFGSAWCRRHSRNACEFSRFITLDPVRAHTNGSQKQKQNKEGTKGTGIARAPTAAKCRGETLRIKVSTLSCDGCAEQF